MKCDVMLTRVMLKVAVYNRYTGCRCHAEGAVCVYSPACGGCSGLLGDLSSVTQPPAAAADTWTQHNNNGENISRVEKILAAHI